MTEQFILNRGLHKRDKPSYADQKQEKLSISLPFAHKPPPENSYELVR